MRKLIILLDGAADERISIFNNRTPLEASRKDFMDGVAHEGKVGTTDGKDYTHTFLLELLTGRPMTSRGASSKRMGWSCP